MILFLCAGCELANCSLKLAIHIILLKLSPALGPIELPVFIPVLVDIQLKLSKLSSCVPQGHLVQLSVGGGCLELSFFDACSCKRSLQSLSLSLQLSDNDLVVLDRLLHIRKLDLQLLDDV